MPRQPTPIPRTRLTDALAGARVAVVEASGGYGKSTLARLLADELGIAMAVAELAPEDTDARSLLARLRTGLRVGGLSDLAAALGDPTADPGRLADDLGVALAQEREPVLLVIDDAHHLHDADSEVVLDRLVAAVAPPHRLVVLTRRRRDLLARVADGHDAVRLDASDLAFTSEEVANLLRRSGVADGEGQRPAPAIDAILRATAGWPAAVGLLVDDAPPDPEALLVPDADRGALLGRLLDERLRPLGPERSRLVRELAVLPWLSPTLVAEATGDDGLFDAVLTGGLPMTPVAGGRWRIPDPVRERLAVARPDGELASRLAATLARQEDLETAIRLLVTAGRPDDAAGLLADLPPQVAERLDLRTMRGLVRALPDASLERHPRAWLQLARACDAAADGTTRSAALERAAATAAAARDPRFRRELDAEVARDLARDGRADEAEALGRRVADEADADESLTRVRALHTVGRVLAWRADPDSLMEAERLLGDVVQLYGDLGMPGWSAHAALSLAYHVHHPRGEAGPALARLNEALASLSGRQRLRAVLLTFKAEILIATGRAGEAIAPHDEARVTGRALGDRRVLAYVAWNEARAASQAGDATLTLDRLVETERHPGDWFDHMTGVEFLADAAVLADRVGEREVAARCLERARARRGEADQAVTIAEAMLDARTGDPAAAEAAFAALDGSARLETRDRWWLALMRAWAAVRRDDPAAPRLAREAFAMADAIDPGLPFVREPVVAAALQERLAGALPVRAPSLEVRLLGTSGLWSDGRPMDVPPGRPAAILEMVAVAGSVAADEVIERLWPEVDPDTGRSRLRNTLNRLRDAVGPVVDRRGEVLRLADGVTVDAARYERDARAAIAALRAAARGAPTPSGDRVGLARAVDAARSAAGLYAGMLLPDRPFDDWAAEARERLARLQMEVVDRLAAVAERDGDVDEAIRMRRDGIALDPDDEVRYVALARLLLAQGRRGSARAALDAGEASLRTLGLPPTAEMGALRAAIGRAPDAGRASSGT